MKRHAALEVVREILKTEATSTGFLHDDLLRSDDDMHKLRPRADMPQRVDFGTNESYGAEFETWKRTEDSYRDRCDARRKVLQRLTELVAYRGLAADDPLRAIIDDTDNVVGLVLEHRVAEGVKIVAEKQYKTASTDASRREGLVRAGRESLEAKLAKALPTDSERST